MRKDKVKKKLLHLEQDKLKKTNIAYCMKGMRLRKQKMVPRNKRITLKEDKMVQSLKKDNVRK